MNSKTKYIVTIVLTVMLTASVTIAAFFPHEKTPETSVKKVCTNHKTGVKFPCTPGWKPSQKVSKTVKQAKNSS